MNSPTSNLAPGTVEKPLGPGNQIRGYLIAILCLIVSFLLRQALNPILHDRYIFTTFYLAMTILAWMYKTGPAVVVLIGGYLIGDWYFIPPFGRLGRMEEAHIVGTISYFFSGAVTIFFSRSMHLARARADQNAEEAVRHQKQLELEVKERMQAEQEVRRLNEDLELRVRDRTAELLEANEDLESFTYSVSHDLRAPLRHMDGYAQILEREFGQKIPQEALGFTKKIRQGSQNMGRLVDDLLNLSRVGKKELHRQMVPLNPLVAEVIADLQAECAGRKIEWNIGRLPSVFCDTGLMRLVLTNLLSNAAKYTRTRERAVITIDEVKTNGETTIRIQDNGVGFNPKHAEKLFGVFQRLHRSEQFEGTGVGLATVARIIRKHGGRIWADAELEKGATFFFTVEPPRRNN